MRAADVPRAVDAAIATVSALGLEVIDAVVLNNSNRLVLRLRPCEMVARVAHVADGKGAAFEVDLARRLAFAQSPIATLDARVEPQVYLGGGFVITLWTYYQSGQRQRAAPADYASALRRLHAGMRDVGMETPHLTDRTAQARRLVESQAKTPELPEADRQLLTDALRDASRRIAERTRFEQLLHGEPHPGNLLATNQGWLWIDLETACRGPIEFDIAHAPEDVSKHYGDVDEELLRDCRILALAMAISWRWEPNDQLPNGRQLANVWLKRLRFAMSAGG